MVSVVTAKFGDRIPAASQSSTSEVLPNPAKLTTTVDSILRRDTILTTNAPVQSPQSITVTSNAIRIIDPSTQRPTAATLRSESVVSPVSVTSTSQSPSSSTTDSLLSSSSSPPSNFHPNFNSQPQHNNPFLNHHNHNFHQPYNNHHNPHNRYNQGHQPPHRQPLHHQPPHHQPSHHQPSHHQSPHQFRRQAPTHIPGPPPPPPPRPQHGRPPHHGPHPHGPRPNHYYAFPFGNDIPGSSSSSPYASPSGGFGESNVYPPGAPDFMKNLMDAFETLKSRENGGRPGGNGNAQPQPTPTAGYSSPFSSPPSSTVGPSPSPFIPPPPTPGYLQPSTEASSGPTAKASMINTFEKRTNGPHHGENHYTPSEPDGFNFDSFFNDDPSSGFGDISGSGNSGPGGSPGGHSNLNNDPLPGEFGFSSGMNFYPPPPPPPPLPAVGGNNRGHNQNNNHNQRHNNHNQGHNNHNQGHNNQQQNPVNNRGGFAHQGQINHGRAQPQQQGPHRNDLNNQASHHLQLPGQGPMSGYHGGGEQRQQQQQQNQYHPGGYGPAPHPQSSSINNQGHNQGSHPEGIEKPLNPSVGDSSFLPGGVPDPATDPRASLVKEHVGAENTEGKPYGSKMTYSFRDPAKPNNFMEVTEVRMNMNRKYDTPSAGPPPLDIPSAGSHMDMDHEFPSSSTGSSEFFDPFRDDSAGFIDF